ncbi:RxLR-like protein [Plasmopara halstedii]|uniref:RxLR-like protein n=1 Tax=Plasmopara halstedii TaxID=4781 RepID=A0A0P1B5W1_PLAHL|nr:RxLR-like protein [Plasmopara halstedii]CEG49719.1 RxLR-like protein [Plasmopara halstedii]|eukprot:XP_024586088.1 RxLR-like protein [Plasmopara halstedii]
MGCELLPTTLWIACIRGVDAYSLHTNRFYHPSVFAGYGSAALIAQLVEPVLLRIQDIAGKFISLLKTQVGTLTDIPIWRGRMSFFTLTQCKSFWGVRPQATFRPDACSPKLT